MREHKKYCMIFNTSDCTDGVEYDDFEEAKYAAREVLTNWIHDEQCKWEFDVNGIPHPTEEQIEEWDMMIEECSTYVAEWNEEEQDFYDEKMNYWFPEEDDVDWLEWEELKKKYGWS